MYLDEKNEWRPPERRSRPSPPQITERQQRVLGWLIMANVVGLLVAPVGGASIIHAVSLWFTS
ncbi:hypothetical protein FP2506_07336 [Fulvimarina pelagi HTCC2506]|uniref:Uncharacterized protein n=1 Tax=Fulvimarina pelagi HTCC2506 TaxID=314231 RepID=Q0G6S9_9HYPH|nr:hypothetical protein FP2506_07336 [Fulvimarina pelagi HTCC2506]